MPGSTIASQSLSAFYNSAYQVGFTRSQFDTVNNRINVTHSFTTGDLLYIYLQAGGNVYRNRVFAIADSPSQLRIATTRSNALAGIAITLSSIWTLTQEFTSAILSNILIREPWSDPLIPPSTSQSSAKSTISFSPSASVQIDLQTSSIGEGRAWFGLTTTTESYTAYCGLFSGSGFGSKNDGYGSLGVHTGDTILGGSSPVRYDINSPRAIRFVLQNNRISISYRASNNYVTGFTSNVLSNSLPPLVFFVCFGLNNLNINNCTITYL